MRLVADWDLPRITSRNATLSAPIPQDVIAAVHMNYKTRASYYKSDQPVRPVDLCDLRCHVACEQETQSPVCSSTARKTARPKSCWTTPMRSRCARKYFSFGIRRRIRIPLPSRG